MDIPDMRLLLQENQQKLLLAYALCEVIQSLPRDYYQAIVLITDGIRHHVVDIEQISLANLAAKGLSVFDQFYANVSESFYILLSIFLTLCFC
jgi:hypothetical protein